jgi:hypothetical protein
MHQLAMENNLITADVLDAAEFPEIAARYGIKGPRSARKIADQSRVA